MHLKVDRREQGGVDPCAKGNLLERRTAHRFMRLHVALLASALAGCAVGPDYRRPASPAVASYTAGGGSGGDGHRAGGCRRDATLRPRRGDSPLGGGSCSAPRRWIDGSAKGSRTARRWTPPRPPCGAPRRSGAPAPAISSQASTGARASPGRSRRGRRSGSRTLRSTRSPCTTPRWTSRTPSTCSGRRAAGWRRCRRRSTTRVT